MTSVAASLPQKPRKHPRVQLQVPVMFFGNHLQGTGRVATLSHGGCTINSQVSVAPGVTLRLQLTLPDNESPVEVTAAIVKWAAGDQLGIEFRAASWGVQEHLNQFIHSWLQAVPQCSAPDLSHVGGLALQRSKSQERFRRFLSNL